MALRAFATQTKAAVPAQSWDDVSSAVKSEDGKREVASLRNAVSEAANRLKSMSQPVSEPDWAKVEANVDPKLLAAYKKAASSIKWPSYPGQEVQRIEAEFAKLQGEAERLRGLATANVERITAELKELELLKSQMRSLTADEYLARHPELASQVDAETERRFYMPW